MANLKISELNALAGSDLATDDVVAVVDDSASETKKLTINDLIANGVTLISDDTIPGAKILFAAGDIVTADLADGAVTTAKLADDAVTAAKLADESTVDLVTTLPASGAFTGQLALDTDDNSLSVWDGSAWQSIKAGGSLNTATGSTTGIVNIVATTTGDSVAISATIDDTSSANQFLAGPTGAGGTVAYRVIDGSDLPVATTTSKGGVVVNAEGLRMDSNVIEIDNDVTASTTHHVVTYSAKGLVTGGRVLAAADLPVATSSVKGAVIAGTGLSVDAAGTLDHSNSVTADTATKITFDAQGHVTSGDTLAAADIPDLPASKITSGTIGSSLLATGAVTAPKLANESVTKFAGAGATNNVVTFPDGDFKGQFLYDEKNEDLYVYTGTSFVPITVISGNLINAGTYDASTNLISSITTAGSAAGFTVDGALPTPSQTNLNYYVVVDTSGTGSGTAPAVSLAPPDMLVSLGTGSTFQLVDVSNAIAGQTAANISVVATGNISSTDVQAALQELDTEKLAKAGGTLTGNLNLAENVVIVYEGSTADEYETTITVTDPTADRTITFPNVTGNVVTTGDTGTVSAAMLADASIVGDATPSLGGDLNVNGNEIVSGDLEDIVFNPGSSGSSKFVDGSVMIGSTSDPDADLEIKTINPTVLFTDSDAAGSPSCQLNASAGDFGYYADVFNDTGGDHRWYSGGSGISFEKMRLDSDGNLGIGSTSPQAKLEINDSGAAQADTPTIRILANTPTIRFADNAGGTASSEVCGNDDALIFRVSDEVDTQTPLTEHMRLTADGRLGINTTAPATELEVLGSILAGANSNKGQIALPNPIDVSTNSYFQINTQSNTNPSISLTNCRSNSQGDPCVLFGKSAGNVDTPTVVSSSLNFGHLVFSGYDGSAYVRGAQISAQVDGTPAAGSMPGRIVLSTTADSASSPSERVRIDSSGNVGIGTSSPDVKLDVEGDARLLAGTGNATLNLVSSENTLGAGQKVAFFGASRSDTDEEMAYIQGYLQSNSGGSGNIQLGDLIFGTSGSERMRIDSSGVVTVETGYLTLNGNKVGGIEVTLADDAFVEITPPRAGGGWVFIATEGDDAAPDADAYGSAFGVWGTTPSVASASGGASFETSISGPPTGTTGSDAHATLFVGGTSGRVYLENRLGASKTFQITFM